MYDLHNSNPIYISNRRKIYLFFFLISLAISFLIHIGYANVYAEKSTFDLTFFLCGIITSPFITYLVIKTKNIYSACIMLIFSLEMSLMCSSFFENNVLISALGSYTFGFTIPLILIACPLLIYYMLGPKFLVSNALKCYVLISFGIYNIFLLQLYPNTASVAQVQISLAFILLGLGFFTIFSAWSHRLVLLK